MPAYVMAYSMMALRPLHQIIDSMTELLLQRDPVSPYEIEAKTAKASRIVGVPA